MNGYDHLLVRVATRLITIFLLILTIFGIAWREWKPWVICKRLIVELRHAVPPGGRVRFAKMTETFLSEVGVLLLVFPMLEQFINSGHVTPHMVVYSILSGLVFYGIAAALAIYTREEKEEQA